MRIFHVSDQHGKRFPEVPNDVDVVVSSGDFLPDCPYIGVSSGDIKNIKFQRNWITNNAKKIVTWLNGKPFIMCNGNHDRFNQVADILRHYGAECYNVTFGTMSLQGVKFVGFPWINYIYGEWNYEVMQDKMKELMYEFHTEHFLEKTPDILIAHAPPYGILDNEDSYDRTTHYGNRVLADYIDYNWVDRLPKAILCGHVHKANGLINIRGMQISNAATVSRIVEV